MRNGRRPFLTRQWLRYVRTSDDVSELVRRGHKAIRAGITPRLYVGAAQGLAGQSGERCLFTTLGCRRRTIAAGG